MEENNIQRKSPDWKQWIPVYGIYRGLKDYFKGEPSFINPEDKFLHYGSIIYHAASANIIYTGLEKLIQ